MREKKLFGGLAVLILVVVALCGCQAGQVQNAYDDIFESSVVSLVNFSLELQKDKNGEIVKATINGRITTLVDKTLNFAITADFYDKNNNILGNSTITILGLQPLGKAGSSTSFPPPYLRYEGDKVAFVDHVKIRAYEITY